MIHIEANRRVYRYWLFAMLALLLSVGLSAGVVLAGDPDGGSQASDAGMPSQPGPVAPAGACVQAINGSLVASDPDQTGRIFRDDPGSTCIVPQTCAPFDAVPRNYDVYTFTNTTGAAVCVTVDLLTPCEGTQYIQSAVYSPTFNPTSLCTNFVGDIGASPFANSSKSYSVTIPAGAQFQVTVNETSGGALCPSYTLTVSGNFCTPCELSFSDVPADNTFYPSVRCLSCRGVISGYADGTFRPNNPVTRGQLAKMVSNAAGFSELHAEQTFEDVPPENTFHVWIERLSSRGFMAGYTCGGPGEPCVSGKPYFRPNANATRGQTSKIVSNTAGLTETPSDQTFQDVPPTYTFYNEIERLANRGIMSGYACGGPGEPCVAPENRPYFRPVNNVTRGQSSKIVAGAFYPGCVTP